jgi:protein TonB
MIPVALTAHVAVLASVAVAQYWTVDPVAEPPIQVSFMNVPAMPAPPPPGPPPAPASGRAQRSIEIATADLQPVAIPDEISPAPDFAEVASLPGAVPGGLPNGVANGVPNGHPDGVPWGVPNGKPGANGIGNSTAGEIVHVRGDVVSPVVLRRVQPVYTEMGRRTRTQGVVIVEAIIDGTGRVTDVRVIKPLPMGLSESAVEAVRQWRFEPATLNGRPLSVYFTLQVDFKLQ